MARPIKLTETIIKKAQENAAKGMPEKWIAKKLKININTWHAWKKGAKAAAQKDEKDLTPNDEMYLKFLQHLDAGYANKVEVLIEGATAMDLGSPRDKLNFLARMDPDSFAEKIPFDHEGFEIWLRTNKYQEWAIDLMFRILEVGRDDETQIQELLSKLISGDGETSDEEGLLDTAAESTTDIPNFPESSVVSKE